MGYLLKTPIAVNSPLFERQGNIEIKSIQQAKNQISMYNKENTLKQHQLNKAIIGKAY